MTKEASKVAENLQSRASTLATVVRTGQVDDLQVPGEGLDLASEDILSAMSPGGRGGASSSKDHEVKFSAVRGTADGASFGATSVDTKNNFHYDIGVESVTFDDLQRQDKDKNVDAMSSSHPPIKEQFTPPPPRPKASTAFKPRPPPRVKKVDGRFAQNVSINKRMISWTRFNRSVMSIVSSRVTLTQDLSNFKFLTEHLSLSLKYFTPIKLASHFI